MPNPSWKLISAGWPLPRQVVTADTVQRLLSPHGNADNIVRRVKVQLDGGLAIGDGLMLSTDEVMGETAQPRWAIPEVIGPSGGTRTAKFETEFLLHGRRDLFMLGIGTCADAYVTVYVETWETPEPVQLV